MNLPNEVLKQILVDSGYISSEDFNDAVKSASQLNKKIEDILIFRGYINEESLGKLIAEYLKVPYVNVGRLSISDEILSLLPEKLARWYRIIPFAKEGQSLKLAMDNPANFEALEFAKRQTNLQIIPYFTTTESLMKAFAQYKKNIREYFGRVIAENLKKASVGEDLAKAAEKLPIIKIMDTIMEYAVAERASDVHIETHDKEVIVRFRIDGVLKDIVRFPRGIEAALVARIKILSNLKIDEHRIPQDGRYKFMANDEAMGLRVSIIPGFYSENVVMRLLPESKRPSSLEELGLSGHNLYLINDNIKKPHGMILVTGPTGSGKTTTLYSLLNILNTIEVKICTIEDPIEYGIERVNQIQVNPKAGLTFAVGLRALLRHDPDIIMVGEIRDKETAEIAVHSALTGHLVLSTLHTNNAAGAIPRLLDMGIEGFLVASTVNIVVAQRLVRKICPNCIQEFRPSAETITLLEKNFGLNLSSQKFYKGKGCDECHHSGYISRIGIYEVLQMSEKIKNLVIQRGLSDQLQKQAIAEGMVTMLHDGMNKISAGLTTIEEVLRAVREE
jgi:type IV pilus assembly protein PilB